jgi:cytochrome P450
LNFALNILKANSNSNEEQLKVVVDLWLAGMETTATTMKWAFLYMIRNPEVSKNK